MGCNIIPAGSGANTKYYIQQGADTASKKLLGSAKIRLLHTFVHNRNVISYTFLEPVTHGIMVSSGNGSVGNNFGFLISKFGTIQTKTLVEKCIDVERCIASYEFTNASIGDVVRFQLSAGGGGVIIALQ